VTARRQFAAKAKAVADRAVKIIGLIGVGSKQLAKVGRNQPSHTNPSYYDISGTPGIFPRAMYDISHYRKKNYRCIFCEQKTKIRKRTKINASFFPLNMSTLSKSTQKENGSAGYSHFT
jgi:hypothetical protein